MTAEELQEVKQYMLRELPKALAQDTEFALLLEGMLAERFPRRDEFARLLNELESTRREARQRFDEIDQRFNKVDQRFEKVEQTLLSLTDEVRGLRHWMELNVGGFQTKAGRRLEDVVAGAFKYGLQRSDIRPEQVRLRQKITDEKGLVFRPGRTREVDMIAQGRGCIVFEVKATADLDDIQDLADKVTLVRHLNPSMSVEGVLVMLGAEREHREACGRLGLRLIP